LSHPNSAAILMLSICALTRLWLINHTEVISRDGPGYIAMAREFPDAPLATTRKYVRPVGYPAAIVAGHWVCSRMGWALALRRWDLGGQLVSMISATAAMTALWIFARHCFDARAAFVSTLLLSVSYKWAILGADVMSDALAVALQLWAVVFAIWTLQRLREQNNRAIGLAALAGLF
jgi:hypothetical protein